MPLPRPRDRQANLNSLTRNFFPFFNRSTVFPSTFHNRIEIFPHFLVLNGFIEIDKTCIGCKEHTNKKLNVGCGAVGKTAVVGMRGRGGCTSLQILIQNRCIKL